MPRTSCLLLLILFGHLGAAANESSRGNAITTRAAKQSSRDVKVPRPLVAQIEREYRQFLEANQLAEAGGLKRKLMDVSVELRQKRPGALHEDVRINTPLGGGIIDLEDFITPVRGAFHMRIYPHDEKKNEIKNLRVFFISQAKTRAIGDEEYGAGCGKYMELTSFFSEQMAGPGFELYTADQRYVSVLGGTFVLVSFAKEALQVASVSFSDSRFPELMCGAE